MGLIGTVFEVGELGRRLGTGEVSAALALLHAYRRWGPVFPRYVDGEFAFVLWDSAAGRVVLGRDPSGFHPLFYCCAERDLLFANEVRRLLEWPGMRVRADEQHIAHWLALVPGVTDRTFFEGIERLPGGHVLCFEDGRVKREDYWRPGELPVLRLRDSREYAAGMRTTLETAIRNRLPAKGMVATQLSGGLDSSSLTALAARLLEREGRRLVAFTAVPTRGIPCRSRFADEGPYAAAVAAMHPNVKHVLVRHGQHSTFAMIDGYNAAQQEPIFSAANYDWLHEISVQARRQGAGMLLTSGGGNLTISYDGAEALEELGRRGRLLAAARVARDLRRRNPVGLAGVAHRLIRAWLPIGARLLIHRGTGRGLRTWDMSLIRREFAAAHGISPRAFEEYYRGQDSRAVRITALVRRDPATAMDALWRLGGVQRTDPTRDRRVIEYCLTVPVERFCERGIPRSLIRDAMAGLIPEQVRNERRRGLQAADFAFHFQAEIPEAYAELARMRKVDLAARALDLEAVETLLRQLEAHGGESDCFPAVHRLMRAFSLGRFLRRLEDGTLFAALEETSCDWSSSADGECSIRRPEHHA